MKPCDWLVAPYPHVTTTVVGAMSNEGLIFQLSNYG